MSRVFGFKMVEAPWIGAEKMVRRVDLQDALRTMGTLGRIGRDGVYWSTSGNSYVMVDGDNYWHPDTGKLVDVVSVNGCGEIRWTLNIGHDGSPNVYTKGDRPALIAFGLIDAECPR